MICILLSLKVFSQGTPTLQTITDNGIFDHVFDRFGNECPLVNISLSAERPGTNSSYSASATPTNVCTAGYFDLYFASGSFFDTNPAASAVVCEVFKNVSGFINSPLSVAPNTSNRINIYCANNGPGILPGALAAASGYYIYPFNPINPNGGIIDNQIQKALISGQDPFANLPQTLFAGANNFYSGYVYADPNFSWNTTMSLTTMGSSDYDLYSVILHEVIHALGFSSLMSSTGVSQLGSSNNYYSRYDLFLENFAGSPLLGSPSGACGTSSLTFQGSATDVNPGSCTGSGSDVTTCSIAARYVSTNVTSVVYTPNCFELGSSLSHFEDMCTVPMSYSSVATCSVSPPGIYNNLYFVMSNQTGTGNCYIRRHPRPEERYVLCDLGYNVATTYTSNAASATFNYGGSSCPGSNIWGMHDGINSSGYTFTTATNGFSVLTSSLLANDATAATQISCIEVIYNNTASFSTPGSSLVVNATPGTGLTVLKYLPKNVGGEPGNPTYIYIYFSPGSCSPNSCNMVQNPGFESISSNSTYSCSAIQSDVLLDCWEGVGSPDLFYRNCTNASICNLGNSTWYSTPVIDSHDGPPNNNSVAGSGWGEALKNALSAPLIPGQLYQFSIWAYVSPQIGNWYTTTNSVVIGAWADVNMSNILSFPYQATLPTLATFLVPPGIWTQFTNTFVFAPTSNVNHNCLVISVNTTQNAVLNGTTAPYPFFDDLYLAPITTTSPAFYIPTANNCGNTTFTNLAQYAKFPEHSQDRVSLL